MDQVNFIIREPLIDSKGQVLGYELVWDDSSADENALVALIAEQMRELPSDLQFGAKLFLKAAAPASLSEEIINSFSPNEIVFTVTADTVANQDQVAAMRQLRAKGFGFSMPVADLVKLDKPLIPLFMHGQIRFGVADTATHTKIHASLKQAGIRVVARQISTWADYETAASIGMDAFVGNLYLTSRPNSSNKGLNPAQAMILQLMKLVTENADVKELEGILRRDAALSYKLLRYINSVGFGLGVEIQSLRHAVTMLGYSPLYRWLSLLLATASTSGYTPVLMQAAVVRGRFAELLGQDFLPKNEAENLFVAGMFSLLDRLLGIPMEEVLENIQLSDAVSQALLSREGMYGPFLALAEACEINNGCPSELADSLFIDADRVNKAHFAALTWAQSLKL
jgi:c-di-GMP-related signal transduction protein